MLPGNKLELKRYYTIVNKHSILQRQNHITRTVRRTTARNQKRHKPHALLEEQQATEDKETTRQKRGTAGKRKNANHQREKTESKSNARHHSDEARGPDNKTETMTVHVSEYKNEYK